jgi:hypothetical protein
MGKFNAATAVEAMEYDFSAYNGPQGVIPEPSQGQIEEFFGHVKDISLLVGKLQGEAEQLAKREDATQEEIDKFIEELPEDRIKELQSQFAVWVYDVSSKTLAVDMLQGLPGRIFSAFFRWLSVELSPKGGTGDSKD